MADILTNHWGYQCARAYELIRPIFLHLAMTAVFFSCVWNVENMEEHEPLCKEYEEHETIMWQKWALRTTKQSRQRNSIN